AYEGLTPGETYQLDGEVRTAPAGEETGITATAQFTPEEESGTTTVTFTITAEQVADYAGQDLVVFEYLTLDGEPVAEHTDPEDQAQNFTVEEETTDPNDPDESDDTGNDLPQTGAGIAGLLALGGGVLVVGGASVLLMRRNAA